MVIISRTRVPQNTIFVGDKNETLEAFKSILLRRSQYLDYMEQILDLCTVNRINEYPRSMTVDDFPFCICDMELPHNGTPIVYMLISLRNKSFFYIGKTINPRQRINSHNSGHGSVATEPLSLRPFAFFAYICGFDKNENLMLAVENKWKRARDVMVQNGIYDPRCWARASNSIIQDQNLAQHYCIDEYCLRSVLLFCDQPST